MKYEKQGSVVDKQGLWYNDRQSWIENGCKIDNGIKEVRTWVDLTGK